MASTLLKLKRETVALLSKIYIDHVNTNYQGLKLKIPLLHGIRNGGYIVPAENWMNDYLNAITSTKKGIVFDIGANVGLVLVKLKTISDDIKYYGIEANPSCSFYIQELIRLNKFKNAKLFTFALSDDYMTTQFYTSKAGDSTGSLVYEHQSKNPNVSALDVITLTGDFVIDKIDNIKDEGISLIKIDVEGAELSVLKGLTNTIENFRPFIECEILYTKNQEQEQKALAICKLLISKDYSVIGINKNSKTLEVIDEIKNVGTKVYEQEFILAPNEYLSKFLINMKNNSCGYTVKEI